MLTITWCYHSVLFLQLPNNIPSIHVFHLGLFRVCPRCVRLRGELPWNGQQLTAGLTYRDKHAHSHSYLFQLTYPKFLPYIFWNRLCNINVEYLFCLFRNVRALLAAFHFASLFLAFSCENVPIEATSIWMVTEFCLYDLEWNLSKRLDFSSKFFLKNIAFTVYELQPVHVD